MAIQIFWYMEIGPREAQEDCIMFDDSTFQVEHGRGKVIIEKDHLISAICDGLGGHDAGEVASRFFCDNLVLVDPFMSEKEIDDAFRKIQIKACDLIPSSSGTTMAGIRISNGKGLVFNAGDSRVYHMSGDLDLVSHDHSYVQGLVDQGLITEKAAEAHPYKNIVTFGMGPVFDLKEKGSGIFFSEIDLKQGDGILICSDGVSDSLNSEALKELLLDSHDAGSRLAAKLDEIRIRDNASFVYILIS